MLSLGFKPDDARFHVLLSLEMFCWCCMKTTSVRLKYGRINENRPEQESHKSTRNIVFSSTAEVSFDVARRIWCLA